MSPLAQPIDVDGVRVGNRFCILPMEGWDGTPDGEPSDLTRRRWRNFGISGAKLIWGGEAVAVRHDGRANPHQLLMTPQTQPAIAGAARGAASQRIASGSGSNADGDLFVGLQLTHSGRYARPDVYDRAGAARRVRRIRCSIGGFRTASASWRTRSSMRLVDDFVAAARLARDAGFRFVDVKACHGYLGHELLGARDAHGAVMAARSRAARGSCAA